MSDAQKPDITADAIRRSTRDRDRMRDRLQAWLAERLPGAEVVALSAPANGMSSETLLFDATWSDDDAPGGHGHGRFVARVEPPCEAVPVFPTYDLGLQHRLMTLVAERTDAPVPKVLWAEDDPAVLGGAFFVMERVDGIVPPDVLPYTMDGVVLGMDDDQRQMMQDSTVDVLSEIHRVPLADAVAAFPEPGGDDARTALRRHVDWWHGYLEWVRDDRPTPLLDEAVDWLEAHWPTAADERDPVLSWGDARIGNVMYGPDHRPVAVLDWEMAGIAPREVDIGWMSFLHTFFQDITEELGMPGLPGMLRLEDVSTRYTAASGIAPLDIRWFEVYAAFRHGVIMTRIHDRQVHFGEAEPVADPDEAVMHRERLRRLISS